MNALEIAVDEIGTLRTKLGDIFADAPEFNNRAQSVLTSLENGFRHLAGMETIQTGNKPDGSFTPTPITKMFGEDVKREAPSVEQATPTVDDRTALRAEVEKAYPTFLTRKPKDILDNVEHMVIRGVAKKAGLDVTSTEPATITEAFVKKVIEAINGKENNTAARNTALLEKFGEDYKGLTGVELDGEHLDKAIEVIEAGGDMNALLETFKPTLLNVDAEHEGIVNDIINHLKATDKDGKFTEEIEKKLREEYAAFAPEDLTTMFNEMKSNDDDIQL